MTKEYVPFFSRDETERTMSNARLRYTPMTWRLGTRTSLNTSMTHPNGLPPQRLLPPTSQRVANADSQQQDQQCSAQYERKQQAIPAIVALHHTRQGVKLCAESGRRERKIRKAKT
jgi:hypothetical protein